MSENDKKFILLIIMIIAYTITLSWGVIYYNTGKPIEKEIEKTIVDDFGII